MAAEALEATFREDWGRLLALLVAQFRRLDLAEDGLAEAFAAAAERWPRRRPPANPERLAADRGPAQDHRPTAGRGGRGPQGTAADRRRRDPGRRPAFVVDPGRTGERRTAPADLPLCSSVPGSANRPAALTLRLVLGVSTADIARLFLVPESTMAARLTRAKRKLVVAGVPFAVPEGAALAGPARLGDVGDLPRASPPATHPDPDRRHPRRVGRRGDPARPAAAAPCCRAPSSTPCSP